jgi:alpha-L-fucosidase
MANKFDPQIYDPDKWMVAAKMAGFTYAVMTSKHHDGYALWPSNYGEMNSGKFLNGRDLLKPYVEACRKNGLRAGFYFSGIDWYHKDFPRWAARTTKNGLNYAIDGIDYSQWRRWPDDDAAEVERHLNGFYDYAKGQLRELLTNYGKIDVLWFDGFPMDWPKSLKDHRKMVKARLEDIHKMIIELQPGIVINNRAYGIPADFQTPERGDGTFPPDDYHIFHSDEWKRKWELCTIWGSHWGYKADRIYRSSEWVIRRLAECRARGGNFLLNSGPTPNGKQPAMFYERCEEIASWMEHSRVSVIRAGALENDWKYHSNVPVTTGEDVWYLHIFPRNKTNKIELENISDQPDRVILLRTGQELQYQKNGGDMSITVSAEMRSELDDVVAVYWKETAQ